MGDLVALSTKAKERIIVSLRSEVHLDFITDDTIRAFVETLALKPPAVEDQLFLMSDEEIALNLSLKFYHFWSSAFYRKLGRARRDLDAKLYPPHGVES